MSMHIDAAKGMIAKDVIVVGDPDRAVHIADCYLTDAHQVSQKRGAVCFTGSFNGNSLSVMATGMGVPSMLIYATELYRDFGCEVIVRVGTGAGYISTMKRNETILAQATCYTSSINQGLFNGTFCPIADFTLLSMAVSSAKKHGFTTYVGNTVCNDRYYREYISATAASWPAYGVLGSEMEGAALYTVAAQFHKKALMLVSVMSKIDIGGDGQEHVTPLTANQGHSIDDAVIVALETITSQESRK